MLSSSRLTLRFIQVAALGLAVIAAGCSSPRRRGGLPPGLAGVPPRLEGSASFFNGEVVVDATTMLGMRGGPDGEGRDSAGGPPGGVGGDFGGGEGRGGRPDAGGGGRPGGVGHEGMESDEGEGVGRPRGGGFGGGMGGAPVRLWLTLYNHSAQPQRVAVDECASGMGSFAVRPEVFELLPGASAKSEPMTSRIAVPGDGYQVRVMLKRGSASEMQIIVLHPPVTPPPAR